MDGGPCVELVELVELNFKALDGVPVRPQL